MTFTIQAHGPADLAANIPAIFGFFPADSFAFVTFGQRQFHGRLDLDQAITSPANTVEILAPAMLNSGTESLILIAYCRPNQRADAAIYAAVLERHLERLGVTMTSALWASETHVGRLDLAGVLDDGEPYADWRSSQAACHQATRGDRISTSREDLAESMAPFPEQIEQATVDAMRAELREHFDNPTGMLAAEVVRLAGDYDERPGWNEATYLLAALADLRIRDLAWGRLTAPAGRAQAHWWLHVARRAPSAYAAAPYALAGFAFWLTGNGAAAWCAVDRARTADPNYRLADILADALANGVPPQTWTGIGDVLAALDTPDLP